MWCLLVIVSSASIVKQSDESFLVICSQLHVFRAVEPALKHRYKQFNCLPNSPPKLYQRCMDRRSEGLATRAQLAKLIFEHQEKAAGAGVHNQGVHNF
ncbi:hypothetical protein BaRGS_00023837 [Batillaria attramentaria]|uniref:Hexosyltransferase n=1 Tax=Batillaria attramentaria TaxID=370345 RepID=A0ABD0KD01_9CAEN